MLHVIRYCLNGEIIDFFTALKWHTPIRTGEILLLVNKMNGILEDEDRVVPEGIRDLVAWKVDNVVHFPNCTLEGGEHNTFRQPSRTTSGYIIASKC
jgi:hypothetical protein